MPTLVHDLTPPQRTWLFETFGHYGENDELQPSAPYQPRRFSDVQNLRDHPYNPYNHPQPHATIFHDHDPPDNRNTIFRRGGGPPPVPPHEKDRQSPIPWSPTGRPENRPVVDSRVFQICQQRPPFQQSNDSRRRMTNSPPTDLLQMQTNSCGKKAPIYPHQHEKLTWLQSFENLQVYKDTYGDCNVPQKYKSNVKLGGWVNKQRKKKKNPLKYGKLSDTQIEAMESLGFKWNVEQV